LALWIGTIKIGLLAVPLKRDGNERPRSYEVFGRRLLPPWAEKLRKSALK
jgi:hypothetical protein